MDVLIERGFRNVAGITNDEAEYAAGRNVLLGDVHCMSMFGDGEVSFLYSKETLEHLVSPWCALLEMNRVTRMGGEFLHLVSTGIDKQRETYHVSCFPDWLWFDLLTKAGFEVDRLLVGHATEVGFSGRKVRTPDGLDRISERYSYDLRAAFNAVPRETLVL